MKTVETWQETLARIPEIPVPTIIQSKPLLNGKHLQLSEKTIQYSDNVVRLYEGCSRTNDKGIVSVLAQTQEKVLILIAEYRPLIAPYWNISLPAGLMDAGYTKEQTCRKELLEETGYTGDSIQKLVDTAPSPGLSNEIVSQYFMPNVTLDPRGQSLEPTEIIEVLRVPVTEIDTLMEMVMERTELFVVDAKIDQAFACAKRKNYL